VEIISQLTATKKVIPLLKTVVCDIYISLFFNALHFVVLKTDVSKLWGMHNFACCLLNTLLFHFPSGNAQEGFKWSCGVLQILGCG